MGLFVDWLTIDCRDAKALAEFWNEALDYRTVYEDSDEEEDEDEVLIVPKDGLGPRILFLKTPDTKSGKNRLHLDLRGDDQAAEVARLEKLGARRVDIGQGEKSWVFMADPEGNEFCILRASKPQELAERDW